MMTIYHNKQTIRPNAFNIIIKIKKYIIKISEALEIKQSGG